MSQQLNLQTYLLTAVLIWASVISAYLIKVVGHYKKLTRGANNISLERVLEQIIKNQDFEAKHIQQLSQNLTLLENRSKEHYQKVCLLRFNPFEDAGGDQSFVIAMLDGHDNGFVISSLHSRSGTRVYAKTVSAGKATAHAFTKEEKEAVDKAQKKKIN
jgi:hypothetical protein